MYSLQGSMPVYALYEKRRACCPWYGKKDSPFWAVQAQRLKCRVYNDWISVKIKPTGKRDKQQEDCCNERIG